MELIELIYKITCINYQNVYQCKQYKKNLLTNQNCTTQKDIQQDSLT